MDIYPLKQGFSVAYLVVDGPDAMLVDTALPGLETQLLRKLDDLNSTLRLIVLTHFHYDHVGSADAIRTATRAPVAIHRKDAEALRRGGRLHLRPAPLFSTMGSIAHLLAPGINRTDQKPVTPDLELDDNEDLTVHGGFGRALPTPGHTPGSISVLLPNRTLLAGDAITRAPLTHTAAGPMFIDDLAATRTSINTITSHADTVHSGHFGTTPSPQKALQRLKRDRPE